MEIKVLYFAQLREKFGMAHEQVDAPASVQTVGDFIQFLADRGGVWAETFEGAQAFRVAMNQEMVTLDMPLVMGADLAIFRPVTGG